MQNTNNPLNRAIQQANGGKRTGGLTRIANACGVTYQAVRKWRRDGRLPRSEHLEVGRTHYAERIAAIPGVTVTAAELRDWSRRGWQMAA